MPKSNIGPGHICLGAFCKCKIMGKGIGTKNKPRIEKAADEEVAIKKDVKHNKDRATQMERVVAGDYKELGFPKARRVPGSGAFHAAMLYADVEVEGFLLVECKQTRSGKLIIEPDWVDKVREESEAVGKRYFALHAWTAEGEDNYRKLVVMDESAWYETLAELNRLKELEKENG